MFVFKVFTTSKQSLQHLNCSWYQSSHLLVILVFHGSVISRSFYTDLQEFTRTSKTASLTGHEIWKCVWSNRCPIFLMMCSVFQSVRCVRCCKFKEIVDLVVWWLCTWWHVLVGTLLPITVILEWTADYIWCHGWMNLLPDLSQCKKKRRKMN